MYSASIKRGSNNFCNRKLKIFNKNLFKTTERFGNHGKQKKTKLGTPSNFCFQIDFKCLINTVKYFTETQKTRRLNPSCKHKDSKCPVCTGIERL